jgi:YjbE family integral membrane protein
LELSYLWSIFFIITIDIILGGDNAIVIALACRKLPSKKRNFAIILGTIIAISLRIILTLGAIFVLKVPFLHLIGGILLLYISYNLLIQENDHLSSIKENYSVFQAIRTIVFADLVMGIDNVLAIAGASNGHPSLVIFGLCISIPIIIWGSKVVLFFLERFPILVFIGAGVLAITAGNMLIEEPLIASLIGNDNYLNILIPTSCVLLIITVGGFFNFLKLKKREM